jgi:ferrochelatase
VLIVNLGTPDAPTFSSVRCYLREFLSDPRVVELPRWLWSPILHGIILTLRPAKVAKAYASIWNREKNESPLRTHTRETAELLQKKLPNLCVEWAFCYGNPSIEQAIHRLKAQFCDKIIVLPLYPQYCAATTGSVMDSIFKTLQKIRWVPSIRIIPPYFDHPAYIKAVAESVSAHLQTLDWQPEKLVLSYHGIPKRYYKAYDPYVCHGRATTAALQQALGGEGSKIISAFQSRFGREEWVKPYLDELLTELPQQNVRKIAVFTPGFAADCLETLEEIADRAREQFLHAGGTHFAYIPCLNATPAAINLYAQLVQENGAGWVILDT